MKNLVIGVKITEECDFEFIRLFTDQMLVKALDKTKEYVVGKMTKVFDLSEKIIVDIEFDTFNNKMYTYVDAIYPYDSDLQQILEETPDIELDAILKITKFCLKQDIKKEFNGVENIEIMFDVTEDAEVCNE